MNYSMKKTIHVVDIVDEMDLRKVISQRTYLQGVAKDYKLKHLEAVVFTNKALTRFRMVIQLFSTVFVCSPWIDKTEQHSMYLKISEEIALMSQVDARVKLDRVVNDKLAEREEWFRTRKRIKKST